MDTHGLVKALEVWILQNMLNLTIALGMIVLGLSLIQRYYRSLSGLLTLRVSIEIWDVFTRIMIDIMLMVVVIIGFMVLNPDIMADIKIGIPFMPVATILFAIAMVLRLFHDGHNPDSPTFIQALWFLVAANISNIIGFSLVMEAPSGEYLGAHPSAFWSFIKANLRSNANLELTQIVFLICFPILILVLLWGFRSGLTRLKAPTSTS